MTAIVTVYSVSTEGPGPARVERARLGDRRPIRWTTGRGDVRRGIPGPTRTGDLLLRK
jgi:hypothetical protein